MAIGYRYFGFLSLGQGDGLRFTWLQVVPNWGWALSLSNRGLDHDGEPWGLTIGIPGLWIYLKVPLPERAAKDDSGFGDEWGFWWRFGREWGNTIYLRWGARRASVKMPWAHEWFRTSYLAADGATWVHELRRLDAVLGTCQDWQRGRLSGDSFGTFRKMEKWSASSTYRYVLKSGEVQECTATIEVHEMEWRWRWFMGIAWPRKIVRSIDVHFSAEVGERAGSWKGGTIGCGYEMRIDENPFETLKRMEAERKF